MRKLLLVYLLLSTNAIAIGQDEKSLSDWFSDRQNWLVEHQIVEANTTPRHINHLITQDSPYLLSHALQPVNWFSWAETPLSMARSNNTLVYLSIGYQTCHWCHVLAQESYMDAELANQLNQNFVSIKVDRETHPELDQKYRRALENMTGNAGWPIQAVLTPNGNILWIDSYTSKSQLSQTLSALARKWNTNPQAIENLAKMQQQQLLPMQNNPRTKATNVAIENQFQTKLIEARRLLAKEQLGQGPRFLRVNWLLLLLDDYLENGNISDLQLVTEQLNQFLTSPTYDFIDGGMHRYAEDGMWKVPHYEKMLYDQALLIRILSRLYLITDDRHYMDFAKQTVKFVNDFLKVEVGYASSLSALSDGSEGTYYHFGSEDLLRPAKWRLSQTSKGKLLSLKEPNFPESDDISQLSRIRHQTPRPLQDEKSVLAWNALYLMSLIELYQVTSDEQFRSSANILANHLMKHFVQNSRLFRIVFEQKPSVDATVEDYAWLVIALNQAHWTFQDERYSQFVKQIAPAFLQRIKDTSWQNLRTDLQLRSAAAVALEAIGQLAEFADPRLFKKEFRDLKANFDGLSLALDGLSLLNSLKNSQKDKFKSVQPFANGYGVAQASYNNGSPIIQIKLAAGWHINSDQPLDSALIATELTTPNSASFVNVAYPRAKIKPLGFSQQPLSLYEGRVEIPFTLTPQGAVPRLLNLRVQACSNKICLLPETVNLIF